MKDRGIFKGIEFVASKGNAWYDGPKGIDLEETPMIKFLIGLLLVVAAAFVIAGIVFWIDEHMNKG